MGIVTHKLYSQEYTASKPLSMISLVLVLACAKGGSAAPPAACMPEMQVSRRTRLDWEFAVKEFGPNSAKLPASYDSRKQLYQLYVPKDYDAARTWPLVVFISPGDDPLGWRAWQKVCEDNDVLF